ncbi:hypothetical protein ACA910_003632 [Epithemia clementina (nom. ined.)]
MDFALPVTLPRRSATRRAFVATPHHPPAASSASIPADSTTGPSSMSPTLCSPPNKQTCNAAPHSPIPVPTPNRPIYDHHPSLDSIQHVTSHFLGQVLAATPAIESKADPLSHLHYHIPAASRNSTQTQHFPASQAAHSTDDEDSVIDIADICPPPLSVPAPGSRRTSPTSSTAAATSTRHSAISNTPSRPTTRSSGRFLAPGRHSTGGHGRGGRS